MSWVKRSAAVVISAVAIVGLAAASASPGPTPPPLIRIAPPPPAPPPPANAIRASGMVAGKRVALLINGERAALAEWPDGTASRTPQFSPIENINTVVAMLADREYQFLWSELERWAGSDLGLFRERLRKQAEAIALRAAQPMPTSSAESAAGPVASGYIRLTTIYMQIGETPLAQQVMETYLGASKPRGSSSQQTMDWVLAKSRLANIMQYAGKVEESFRHYADIQDQAGKSEFALNGMINHAAVLAESGRHAEALALIDRTWEKFRKAGDEGLAGSERQFAWIRACALDGLGRHAEADAAYAVVRNSGAVYDRDYMVDGKESIEWRGQWCRRQESELKAFLLAELASHRPTMAVLALQPGYKPFYEDGALLAKMRADPEIRGAMAYRMRELPARMVPALNKYR